MTIRSVSNLFSEFRKCLNPQVSTCKSWHSLFHRKRQPESFYGSRGRCPRPRLLLEAQRLGLTTTFILPNTNASQNEDDQRFTSINGWQSNWARAIQGLLSLPLSLKEWRSKHLHEMRPTNSIATRNNRVASEKSTPGRSGFKKRMGGIFSVGQTCSDFQPTAITDHDICLFQLRFWLTWPTSTEASTHPAALFLMDVPSSWWNSIQPKNSNQKHYSSQSKTFKTTNQKHRLGQTNSVVGRNDACAPFRSTLCVNHVLVSGWLGTITSYHVSSCRAMFHSFHLCSYLIMFLCINVTDPTPAW